MTNDTLFPLAVTREAIEACGSGVTPVGNPNRAQIELRPMDLDALLAPDYPARGVGLRRVAGSGSDLRRLIRRRG